MAVNALSFLVTLCVSDWVPEQFATQRTNEHKQKRLHKKNLFFFVISPGKGQIRKTENILRAEVINECKNKAIEIMKMEQEREKTENK